MGLLLDKMDEVIRLMNRIASAVPVEIANSERKPLAVVEAEYLVGAVSTEGGYAWAVRLADLEDGELPYLFDDLHEFADDVQADRLSKHGEGCFRVRAPSGYEGWTEELWEAVRALERAGFVVEHGAIAGTGGGYDD